MLQEQVSGNYADVGSFDNEVSGWDDFDGESPDHSVVYNIGDQIISSRRWEAFKQGIEDYELLVMYERRFGKKPAMEICTKVLSNPLDETIADQIKNTIINLLNQCRSNIEVIQLGGNYVFNQLNQPVVF